MFLLSVFLLLLAKNGVTSDLIQSAMIIVTQALKNYPTSLKSIQTSLKQIIREMSNVDVIFLCHCCSISQDLIILTSYCMTLQIETDF